MRGTGKWLRNLLGCCALALAIGAPAEAADTLISMDVIVDGVTTTVAYWQTIDVVRGKNIAITPHSADIKGLNPVYYWTGPMLEDRRISTVSVNVSFSTPTVFKCAADSIDGGRAFRYAASVRINPVDPPTLSIGTGIGSAGVLPGEDVLFTAVPVGAPGGQIDYSWAIVDSGGRPVDEAAYTKVENGGELRLTVAENEHAWKLYGAKAECTVTRDGNFLVSADSSALEVGIEIDPSSTRPWNVDGPVTLKLNSVLGGNAASEDLKYRWQVRTEGQEIWTDLPNATGFSSTIALPDGGSGDYRCLVDLRGGDGSKAVASGVFEVRKVEHALDISDTVDLEPGDLIVTNDGTGTATAMGTILKPANRSEGVTSYTYEVLRKAADNSWTVVAVDRAAKNHSANESFSLAFTPAAGTHTYKLRVTSDVGVSDESGPFVVCHVNKDPNVTKAAGTSVPAASGDRIPVRVGESILYTLAPEGGSGFWTIDWYEDGRKIEGAEGVRRMDTSPTHGKAISAKLTIADRDGQPVPNVEPLAWKFEAPRVELEWDRKPADAVVHYKDTANDARVELYTVGALGGRGAGYTFSFAFGTWEGPESTRGWWPVPHGKVVVARPMFAPFHDFSDGKTARFPLWFKATDGEQEIPAGPIVLTVARDPVLFLDGTDPNTDVRWNEALQSYETTLLRGFPLELTAALVGDDFEGHEEEPRYVWKWDGGTSEARSWTPPAEWPAGDYEVTVEAFDEGRTPTAVATVLVHVVDRVDAHGTIDRPSVQPGEPVSLTVRVVTHGSGSYEFLAGREGEPLQRLQDDDIQAVRTEPAPMTPGVHALHWRVKDLATGHTDSGAAHFAVTADPGPGPETIEFRIFPESGAVFSPGGSFDMVVVSEGTRKVAVSDLEWRSSAPRVATVNSLGGVRVLEDGEVVFTATLKSDGRYFSSWGVAIPDRPIYMLVLPSLVFEEGIPVDVEFESFPSGAAFTHSGLPGGLTLSSGGRLTGTAPKAGTYILQSVTATWPNGRIATRGPVRIVVTGNGRDDDRVDHDDNGGGCNSNGDFGFPAFALSAFWVLTRKKAI